MSDRWMDERQRHWRERRPEPRYGRDAHDDDYGQSDYRADREDRSFSGSQSYGRGYGGAPAARGAGGRDFSDRGGGDYGHAGYEAPYGAGQPYGRHDDPAHRSYGAQTPRYGGPDYETRAERERPQSVGTEGYGPSGYGPAEAYDYYRAGYTGRTAPEAREEGGRGFLDRAADQVASWFGAGRDGERQGHASHRGRGPKGYRRSDARVSEDVHDRLTDDPWLDASEIEVAVSAGEVTLAGTVADREAKHRAERCVERVSGVDHVQNNLRIGALADTRPFESGSGNPLTTPGRGFGDNILDAQAHGETGKGSRS